MAENNLTKVTVKIAEKKYETFISARQHTLVGDEPEDLGGEDLGMAPYELLLGSLGECTAITLKMYAERKGWQIDGVTVNLTLEEMTPTNRTTRIGREVIVEGENLTPEQRTRLLQIANACPVHKILTNPISIETLNVD